MTRCCAGCSPRSGMRIELRWPLVAGVFFAGGATAATIAGTGCGTDSDTFARVGDASPGETSAGDATLDATRPDGGGGAPPSDGAGGDALDALDALDAAADGPHAVNVHGTWVLALTENDMSSVADAFDASPGLAGGLGPPALDRAGAPGRESRLRDARRLANLRRRAACGRFRRFWPSASSPASIRPGRRTRSLRRAR